LVKNNKKLLFIPLLLFLILPFRVDLRISPVNINQVSQLFSNKRDYFNIYKLPNSSYITKADVQKISSFIKTDNNIFVYPFDSFLLNINNKTYNSYPLQFYLDSGGEIEKRGVLEMQKNPPDYIIFGIDKKFNIDLDGMPNITRNPILFNWMLSNYSVYENEGKYLILKYGKDNKKTLTTKSCTFFELKINIFPSKNIFNKLEEIVKKPIYYLLGKNLTRITSTNNILTFDDYTNVSSIANLFSDTTVTPYQVDTGRKNLNIIKVSPITRSRLIEKLNNSNAKITCLN
jgi:hypothetical protein